MDERDLRFDIHSWGAQGECAVRVTHLPTGIHAEATGRGRVRTRDEALRKLESTLCGDEH